MHADKSLEAREVVAKVASRLKSVRKEQHLTLAQLAANSNVSRSMLSQIERGETNPTLATLWNLTRALGVDFAGLLGTDGGLQEAQGAIERITSDQIPTIDGGRGCRLNILSPPHFAGQFEWYEMDMEPGGVLASEPHAPGSREHLTVLSGRVTVRSGSISSVADAGETLRYRADLPHSITNARRSRTRCLLVVTTV